MINFTSIKFFSLTLVAVVNNFAPLLTVALAALILGERMLPHKTVQLIVAFGGALLMILVTPAPVVGDNSSEGGNGGSE